MQLRRTSKVATPPLKRERNRDKLSGRAELRLRVKSTLEVTFHAGKIQSAVMKSLFVVEVVKQRLCFGSPVVVMFRTVWPNSLLTLSVVALSM